jgi:hypothetical protein
MIAQPILGETSSSRRYDRCFGTEEWFILGCYDYDTVNCHRQEDPLNTDEWQGYIWEILSYHQDAVTVAVIKTAWRLYHTGVQEEQVQFSQSVSRDVPRQA